MDATPAEMAPAYEAICEELGWGVDTAKLEALQRANQQRLEQLDAAIKDAEANLGDVEVREARAAKADYLCKIGVWSYLALAFIKLHKDGCSVRNPRHQSHTYTPVLSGGLCACAQVPSVDHS